MAQIIFFSAQNYNNIGTIDSVIIPLISLKLFNNGLLQKHKKEKIHLFQSHNVGIIHKFRSIYLGHCP